MLAFPLCLLLAAADPAAAPAPASFEFHGEVRTRAELLRELDLDEDRHATSPPQGDGERMLLRSRLSVTATPVEKVGVFLQLQDSRVFGEEATTATALGAVDLHQGYAELRKLGGAEVMLRVGRMELAYGDQRLLGAFGWDNVGRSFDGALARFLSPPELTVDLFWTRLHADPRAAPERAAGDDLAGVYASWKRAELLTLDLYTLVLYDRGADADTDGDGEPDRFRFPPDGGELQLLVPGLRADVTPTRELHLNGELVFQTGSRGSLDVSAWALHASADYTLPVIAKPKLLAGFDRASGDSDPADHEWGTFENLFPTNHDKYGLIDLAAWKNLADLYGGLSAKPHEQVTVGAVYHRLARVETADTFYRASGAPLRPRPAVLASGTQAREVGHELDLTLTWAPEKYFTTLLGVSKLWSGGFLDETATAGSAPDPFFAYLQLTGAF